MQNIYAAAKVFTGEALLEEQAIVVQDGIIQEILPVSACRQVTRHYGDHIIAPAFIDAQVYGAAGKLFAVYRSAKTLERMHEVFSKEGTCLFQPTLATNTVEVFKECIDAVRAYQQHGRLGVHGLHLEGPWLNEVKRGAHVKEWIHSPSVEEVKDLLEYGRGIITMITIAPEVCSDTVIDLIRSYNVVISAGHSNATYEEAMQSFDRGIPTVTHLYNAMSALQHRAPGLVGAVFNHPSVRASIIPDGYHVDFAAIRIAKKIMRSRLFAITDAVTETGEGPYQHHLAGDKYECNGTLSGSALSMHGAFYNLVHKAGLPVEEAHRMCSLYPAQVLGVDHLYGKIVPQSAGQLVVLDKTLQLREVLNG